VVDRDLGREPSKNVGDEFDIVVSHPSVGYESHTLRRKRAALDAKLSEFMDDLARLRMVKGDDVGSTRRGIKVRFGKRGGK
jgi:hypothetical protein